jgi:Zn finger protein HypA/HybF involved in hydrogenase expression
MSDFKARCGACDHVFTVLELPAPLDVAAFMMTRAKCPRCDSKKLYVASEWREGRDA